MHAGSGALKKALLFLVSESVFFLQSYYVCRVTSPLGFLFNLRAGGKEATHYLVKLGMI